MSDPLPEELPPNFEFGDYLIRACIGRGGMARVYRADRAALNRAVALKVLDQWLLGQPGGAERFLREARTAASIKHPNVVDLVDVGVWQERPFLVMELLTGCDLETYLARHGPLAEVEVVGLALSIIAGVLAVHEAGVVHRDLKPSNIFLATGPDGEVIPKVLDFGVSKFSDKLMEPTRGPTRTREIIGTPAYMAPEALNGVRELGPGADQYALGAILYQCAVGRPPFAGDTLLELLKAIALGNIVPPRALRPELSPDFEAAVLRTLNGVPTARFGTLRDLGHAFWRIADERSRTIWERSFGGGPLVRSSSRGGKRQAFVRPLQPHALRRVAARAPWAWGAALCASVALTAYVVKTRPGLLGGAEEPRALPATHPVEASVSFDSLLVGTPAPRRTEPEAARTGEQSATSPGPHLAPLREPLPEPRADGAVRVSPVHALPGRRAVAHLRRPQRRAPARVSLRTDAPSDPAVAPRGPVDPELQELFESRPAARPAARANPKEPQLDDPFPTDAPDVTDHVGANGSPVLD